MCMKRTSEKGTRTIADIIKHEGIKAKGFGIIAKFAMHDLDMTPESKSILGYLCSLCGSGSETFPSRATILKHLKLSKNGYYKHYNALIEHGYIRVEKVDPSNVKSPNVYIIVELPKKVLEFAKTQGRVVTGIYDFGYGIIPRAVMMDERLDIKAKVIYCYHASYAGAGNATFPQKKHILYHLNISEKTYYRYYNQLIQYNYITPVQRHVNGRLGVCDYTLNRLPDEDIGILVRRSSRSRIAVQVGKKEDTAKTSVKWGKSVKIRKKNNVQVGKKEDSTNEDGIKEDSTNEDTTNTSGYSNSGYSNTPISARENFEPAAPPIDASQNFSPAFESNQSNQPEFEKFTKTTGTASPDLTDLTQNQEDYSGREVAAAPLSADKAKKMEAYSDVEAVRVTSHLASYSISTDEEGLDRTEKFCPPPVENLSNAAELPSAQEIADKVELTALKAEYPDYHKELDIMHTVICNVLANGEQHPPLIVNRQPMELHLARPVFALLTREHLACVMDAYIKRNEKHGKIRNAVRYFTTSLHNEANNPKISITPVKQSNTDSKVPIGFNPQDFRDKIARETKKLLED